MSNFTADQPPPLPPRSPRPPVNGHHRPSQPSVSNFPPPPGHPPTWASAAPSTPIGPAPPLPPRPAGYEIRKPSFPVSSTHPPSASYISYSIDQYRPNFPPPPPGPPPSYIAPVSDFSSSSQQHHIGRPTNLDRIPALTTSTAWTNLPPPPPGPPPQVNIHSSPGIPQPSCHPCQTPYPTHAPTGSPTAQPLSESPQPRVDTLVDRNNNNNTHTHGSEVLAHPTENLDNKPNLIASEEFVSASTSSHTEQSPREEHVTRTPFPAVSPIHVTEQNSASSSREFEDFPPIRDPSNDLESSFHALHLTSTPPIPSKIPLASSPTQGYDSEPATIVPGESANLNHSTPSVQAPNGHDRRSDIAAPISNTESTSTIDPMTPQEAVPPASSELPSKAKPKLEIRCIQNPMTFSADWYWHPSAPDFFVCKRCHIEHIKDSIFEAVFRHEYFTDGKPRACRFGRPRMQNQLYKEALASGSLDRALEWMRKRPTLVECKGVNGVSRDAADGITWYHIRGDEVRGFIVCDACYEDYILARPRFAERFQVHPHAQPARNRWACDVAIPYIEREYEERAKQDDWEGFVRGAKARLDADGCDGTAQWFTDSWYFCREGPADTAVCGKCYFDKVAHFVEEGEWGLFRRFGLSFVTCAFGVYRSRTLMMYPSPNDKEGFKKYWDAVCTIGNEKLCHDDGIVDGSWYTLPSNPNNFGICSSCYVGIMKPLDLDRFWVPKLGLASGVAWFCCINRRRPRVDNYVSLAIEMFYKADPTPLDEYVSTYAAVPECSKKVGESNRRWYGWEGCRICAECYFDFARHGPLDKLMEYHDAVLEETIACEMYSKRMRTLYTECGSAEPADPKPLLEFSARRRAVYDEVVPALLEINRQQSQVLERQKQLNIMSSLYTFMGQMQANTNPSSTTFGAPGVGYGYANGNVLQGAIYGKQASEVAAEIMRNCNNPTELELRAKWDAVE